MAGRGPGSERFCILQSLTPAVNPLFFRYGDNECEKIVLKHLPLLRRCCALDGANLEHAATIDEATSVWLDRPVCEVQVLESVFGRADQTDVEERLEFGLNCARISPRFAASRMGHRIGDCQAARTVASGRSAFNDEGVAGTVVVVVCRPMAGRSTEQRILGTSLARGSLAGSAQLARPVGERALRTLGFKGSTQDSPKTLIRSGWRSTS